MRKVDYIAKFKKLKVKPRPPGSGRSRISFNIWTPKVISFLGKVPDTMIAKKLGVAQPNVSRKRRLLGISPWQKKTGRTTRLKWKNRWDKYLGKTSDQKLAEKLQKETKSSYPSKETVTTHRQLKKIPSYRSTLAPK